MIVCETAPEQAAELLETNFNHSGSLPLFGAGLKRKAISSERAKSCGCSGRGA